LYKILSTLLDPGAAVVTSAAVIVAADSNQTGDAVIMEAPSYPGTLSILRPLGAHIISVPVDADGLPPQLLQRALHDAKEQVSSFAFSTAPAQPQLHHRQQSANLRDQGRRVKAICIIPNGQNPSGCTMSLERRKQVYSIARQHNVLIVEDDPYYFIQYSNYM
jgi:DNA-binding transcriptional MocR family regulator